MEPSRQKWTARLLLATGTAAGLLWLASIDFGKKVSTDLLDLIPAAERNPELALVRTLASDRQARVALFALHLPDADEARRSAATATFIGALRSDPAFAEVVDRADTSGRDALGKAVFDRRLDLLLPGALAARRRDYAAAGSPQPWPEWLAARTAAGLEEFLQKPEALAFQDLLPADPLLLVPGLVDSARILDPARDAAAAGEAAPALVWARTTAAPLTDNGQQPVFDAVDRAAATARAAAPGLRLEWTSIGRFAAANRERMQREFSLLNLVSLAAVLGIAALCVRHVLKALHLAPVMLGAMLGAWVATTVLFPRVHVLVFVIGALLGGVAVDYGFYLYLQPAAYPGEKYRSRAGRLIRPLLASALTTVLGFTLLLFSELPLIRQLGIFVSAGLLCALATALLWFAQLDSSFLATRAFARARFPAGPRTRLAARLALLAGAAVALTGPWRLQWRDNIRELEIPAPALAAEAAGLRVRFGASPGRSLYLTHGASPAAAREALTRFLSWNAAAHPGSSAASLGLAVPDPADWRTLPSERDALAGFAPSLRTALAARGFEPDGFEPFFTAWESWLRAPLPAYDDTVQTLAASLQGPSGLLLSPGPGAAWFVTIADHPPGLEPPPETSTAGLDQIESLNRLFSHYRASALRLSAIGLGLVGLSVFVLYGLRRGAVIFALPSGSCLFAFGVLGLAGQTLNLFHLLGAFLGVCLSHNYAIFSAENAARGDEPPPSIRLSALTTAASFGVLALSQIPVVAALGTTVSLIVVAALAGVELSTLARSPVSAAPAASSPSAH